MAREVDTQVQRAFRALDPHDLAPTGLAVSPPTELKFSKWMFTAGRQAPGGLPGRGDPPRAAAAAAPQPRIPPLPSRVLPGILSALKTPFPLRGGHRWVSAKHYWGRAP